MWLGTTLEFVIQRDRVGHSLPYQSSHSATFTDSTPFFTFIASLSSIQAQTPQMSVTWGDDDNEDAVSRGVIDMLSNFTVFDIISIPQPRGRQYQHEAISLIYPPPSFTYLRLIYPHLVHISPSYIHFSWHLGDISSWSCISELQLQI